MQKHEKLALAAVRELVSPHGGAAEHEQAKGHGHGKIELIVGTRKAYVAVSSSPRDRDGCVNMVRQAARRQLREWGLT